MALIEAGVVFFCGEMGQLTPRGQSKAAEEAGKDQARPGSRECKLRWQFTFATLDRVGYHDPTLPSMKHIRNIFLGPCNMATVPLVAWRVAVKWFPDNGTPDEGERERERKRMRPA